ncbi:Mitochondrial distribution and morphology protein 12 [Allomyces javanicus]|nr:Mitochondrial distribution and morphology protein 12 [Allomyces javanicus]
MSLDINWSLLDEDLAHALESYLNDRISAIQSPYVRHLRVSNLRFGSTPPDITLLSVVDPFDEFYHAEPTTSDTVPPSAATSPVLRATPPVPPPPAPPMAAAGLDPPARHATDVQIHVHVAYRGDVAVDATAQLGAPLPGGGGGSLWLPVQMHLRGCHLDALLAVAVLGGGSRVAWCLLETEDETGSTSVIKALTIETSVGDASKQMLHNVTKVEKFLVDELHRLLDQECVWPNYQTVVFQR